MVKHPKDTGNGNHASPTLAGLRLFPFFNRRKFMRRGRGFGCQARPEEKKQSKGWIFKALGTPYRVWFEKKALVMS